MSFTFKDSTEATGELPLLIGLLGPSGGGKTLSALRLAAGIQRVRGGNIVGIDTEASRMLHYREQFKFKHLDFGAPFSSDRYAEAIEAAVGVVQGGVVIVDSASHEHEGAGGYLEYHEAELDRMAGDDYKKRERMKFTAWIKPSASRRRLINSLLQKKCAFIFNFRAKEKIKVVAGGQPIQLGWQAIAGEEFSFEMVARCLLPPGANGVPDWTKESFEHLAAKRMDSHRSIIPDGQQLNEDVGEKFALWAKGGNIPTLNPALKTAVENAALLGTARLKTYWDALNKTDKALLQPLMDGFKKMATEADINNNQPKE